MTCPPKPRRRRITRHYSEATNSPLAPPLLSRKTVTKPDGSKIEIPLKVRLDTPAEVDYYNAGGILPYVLDQILA